MLIADKSKEHTKKNAKETTRKKELKSPKIQTTGTKNDQQKN